MAATGGDIRDAIIAEVVGDSALADSVQDALGDANAPAWKEEASNSYHSLLSIMKGIAVEMNAKARPTAGTPTSGSPGSVGDMQYDDGFLYIYTATGWKSVALTVVP